VNKNKTLEQFKWVDTHCHLQLWSNEIDEKELFNLEYVVIPGVDVESSLKAKQVSNSLKKLSYWSAGLHPHQASEFEMLKQSLDTLFIEADLIGETGLDYYRNLSSKEDQIDSFLYHLEVGEKLSKPVIVHCRDSFSDIYKILSERESNNKIILHSWTGGNKWTKKFAELGVYFSISGIVTYDTAQDLQLAVNNIPLNKILVETDIPYLAPEPYKGQKNKPSYIMYTAEKISKILDISLNEFSELTKKNTDRLLSRDLNE